MFQSYTVIVVLLSTWFWHCRIDTLVFATSIVFSLFIFDMYMLVPKWFSNCTYETNCGKTLIVWIWYDFELSLLIWYDFELSLRIWYDFELSLWIWFNMELSLWIWYDFLRISDEKDFIDVKYEMHVTNLCHDETAYSITTVCLYHCSSVHASMTSLSQT